MAFRRSKRSFHSISLGIFTLFAFRSFASDLHPYPTPTLDQARQWYGLAKTNYLINTGNTTSAWKFAEACFEWAEFARNSDDRAKLAHEGIAAAKFAAEIAPTHPAGHFFLAMNKGQLARTKSIGALSLVKEMESSLLRSIKLDPKFDNAAAERSLGLLYLNAPGWPASIGSKSKARKHLERAVELAPDYPTNLLTLMDAYVHWEDAEALHTAMNRHRRLIPVTKEKYKGPLWENSWKDWEERWAKIREQSQDL